MRWTEEQYARALAMHDAGKSDHEIGVALGRTAESVRTARRDRRLGHTANRAESLPVRELQTETFVGSGHAREADTQRDVMGRIGRRIAKHGIGAPGRYHVAHVSDLHAGSKHFDGKALLDFLRFAKGRGLCGVVSTGDNIDGMSEKLLSEQRAYGMDEQHEELIDIFAAADMGVPVWSISGNHDGYCDAAAGTDSGTILSTKMRERGVEWHHLGSCVGRVIIHRAKIELWHGAGGAGTKNSVRRVLNHRAEGYLPGDAPQVLLVGHYHRDAQFVATEGILCVSGRTFQRKRSEFANRIAHPWDVGGGILSWSVRADGTAGEFAYESFPYMSNEAMGWAA